MIPPIGQQLRTRREQMNLTLRDVSHRTRIPAATLRCLEEADYARLGGLAYACSFLRSYSRSLGINADESIEMLKTAAPAASSARIHGGQLPYDVWHGDTPLRESTPAMPPLVALSFLMILFVGSSGFWISSPVGSVAESRPAAPALRVRTVKPQPLHALSYTPVTKTYAAAQEGQ
jgi:cytoskeletal protein RodZ